MALRSALPFHNQWPSVAFALMPNSALSPIQTADVQVGDICYDDTTQTYYYCQDATLSAAVWLPLSGGPPPSGPDHQFPSIIVGNALNGDTLLVCDILDPGDGSGIQLALTSATYGNIGGFAQDVYVRPGVYGPTTLNIPEGVRLLGAGRGRTILTTQDSVTAVELRGDGGELADVTIAVNTINPTSTGSAHPFVTVSLDGTSVTDAPFAIRRVNIDVLVYNPDTIASPALACVGLQISGVPVVREGHKIHDVRCAYLGAGYTTGNTLIGQLFTGLSLSAPTYDPLNGPPVEVDVRNFSSISTEVGFYTNSVTMHLDRCVYDGTANANFTPTPGTLSFGFYLEPYAVNSTLDSCVAKQSIATSRGFLVNAPYNTFSTNITMNSCSAYRDPTIPPAVSAFGFTLFTINSGTPLRGVRMYGCKAENYDRGFRTTTAVENTTAIGCVSANNTIALDDNGTGNDFGHLQII